MNIISVTDSKKYQIGTYSGKDLEQYYDPNYKNHFIIELKLDECNIELNAVLVVEDSAFIDGDFSNFQIEEVFENIRNKVLTLKIDDKLFIKIENELYAEAGNYAPDFKMLTVKDATYNHGTLYIVSMND